jgi:hypothetical protein
MRVIVRSTLLALVVGLVVTGAAQAAITTTAITSPTDPTFAYDSTGGAASATLTVTGTTNSTVPATDTVDIDCYADDGSAAASGPSPSQLAEDVPLQSDGSFSTSITDEAIENAENGAPCRLRAVPSGAPPTTGLSSFTGPRYLLAYLDLTQASSSAPISDYYVFAPQLGAANDYDSLGACGLDDSYTYDATYFGASDAEGFYCNDYYSEASGETPQVDGNTVVAPGTNQYESGPYVSDTGYQGLTVSVEQNPSNGDIEITEVDPLMTCTGDSTCANASSDTLASSGVEDTREIIQTDSGHVVYIHDVYSSTDGKSHQLALNLENDQSFGDPSNVGTNIGYEFPGQSSFSTVTAKTTEATGSTVPASILIDNDTSTTTAAGSPTYPLGAVTFGTLPSSAFSFPTNGVSFFAPYTLTVPASGGVSLSFAYSTDTSQSALASDVLVGDDMVDPPDVAFATPANGSTQSTAAAIATGTATAGSGVKSVTVNGISATVASGKFGVSVPLAAGANKLTATLTSNSGATTTATETVNYTPPVVVTATATTGSASAITTTGATVSGTASPGSAAGTYMFEYGTSTSYGKDTTPAALAANAAAATVTAKLTGLKPGTKYHYRLVVSGVAGADKTFTTKKDSARKLTLAVKPKTDTKAPYKYKASGALTLPSGVSKSTGCKGTITITFKHGKKTVATVHAKLAKTCKYSGTASIKGSKLKGHGSLKLGASFSGNTTIAGKTAKALTVKFG